MQPQGLLRAKAQYQYMDSTPSGWARWSRTQGPWSKDLAGLELSAWFSSTDLPGVPTFGRHLKVQHIAPRSIYEFEDQGLGFDISPHSNLNKDRRHCIMGSGCIFHQFHVK